MKELCTAYKNIFQFCIALGQCVNESVH